MNGNALVFVADFVR